MSEKNEMLEVVDVIEKTQAVVIREEGAALLKATLAPVAERLGRFVETSQNMVLFDEVDSQASSLIQVHLKEDMYVVHEVFDCPVQRAHELHQALLALRNRFLRPLELSAKTIKEKQIAFAKEQERKAAELQRKLQAEADERARVAREKAEAAARIQREKEEAARREAEEARRKAAEATNAAERDRLAKEAEAREAVANKAQAAAQRNDEKAALVQSAPVLMVETPKVEGLKTRTDWTYEIVDAASIPREYCVPDTVMIGKIVKAMKGNTKIAGLRVYSRTV